MKNKPTKLTSLLPEAFNPRSNNSTSDSEDLLAQFEKDVSALLFKLVKDNKERVSYGFENVMVKAIIKLLADQGLELVNTTKQDTDLKNRTV